jgi:hypothetical protein
MLAKERFKSVRVPLSKKVQDAACLVLHPPFPLLLNLTAPAHKRLHAIGMKMLRAMKKSAKNRFS